MLTVLGGLPAWARAEQAPPASVSQQQTELNQFLTYYYQDPQPERAPELLAQLLMGQLPYASRPSDEHHNRGLMIYFFGRIARDHPAVIRRYEALFPTLPAEGQGMLLNVLQVCGDRTTRAQMERWAADPKFSAVHARITDALGKLGTLQSNPADYEAKTAFDLDLLWFEFFATGAQ